MNFVYIGIQLLISGEEDIAFISMADVASNSMAKLPEKGILKKHGYGAVDGKDKWADDSQSEQLEAGSQSDGQEPAGAVADMEYKFKVRKELYLYSQTRWLRW